MCVTATSWRYFPPIEIQNVDPRLINPWLINRGLAPFGGNSSVLEGTPP